MGENGNERNLLNDLSEEWDEERGDEYEVNHEMDDLRPIRSSKRSTFRDITTENGFEFETNDETTEAEKEELGNKERYWTKEEIMTHLTRNPKPDDYSAEDCDDYDQRLLKMDSLIPNGVYKRVIRCGNGEVIGENSAVLYNLNAFLEGQDEPFDSTWLRGRPYLHKLSYDTVLPGLCKGLLTMRRGERSELIVRPQYAYLEMGCPPRVPENATILYIVEVIKVFEEGSLAHFETLGFEERDGMRFDQILELCDSERKSGNSYFVQKRFRESAFRFRRAIRCLEQLSYKTQEDEKRAKDLLLKLYVNIANTYNKFQKPFNAMSNCKKALAIDSQNVKALYQYGLAKIANADYEDAHRYLIKAMALKPRNSDISDALQKLDSRMNGDRIVEDNLYRKMGSAFAHKD